MGNVHEIQPQVIDILRQEMNLTVASPDTDLIEAGQLDSLALVDLLMHVEGRFGVSVDMTDLDLENLRSARAIAGLVAKLAA